MVENRDNRPERPSHTLGAQIAGEVILPRNWTQAIRELESRQNSNLSSSLLPSMELVGMALQVLTNPGEAPRAEGTRATSGDTPDTARSSRGTARPAEDGVAPGPADEDVREAPGVRRLLREDAQPRDDAPGTSGSSRRTDAPPQEAPVRPFQPPDQLHAPTIRSFAGAARYALTHSGRVARWNDQIGEQFFNAGAERRTFNGNSAGMADALQDARRQLSGAEFAALAANLQGGTNGYITFSPPHGANGEISPVTEIRVGREVVFRESWQNDPVQRWNDRIGEEFYQPWRGNVNGLRDRLEQARQEMAPHQFAQMVERISGGTGGNRGNTFPAPVVEGGIHFARDNDGNVTDVWTNRNGAVETLYRGSARDNVAVRTSTERDDTGTTIRFHVEGNGGGANRVSSIHRNNQNQLESVTTTDGRVFRRGADGRWSAQRGSEPAQVVSDVQVDDRGALSYRPADASNRRIRETQAGLYYVQGPDGVERQYVDSSQYPSQPGPPERRNGLLMNNLVGTRGQLGQRAHGGMIRNDTEQPIIVFGNGVNEQGPMHAYVLRPGQRNNPVTSDVDGVLTDARYQPVVTAGGRILMPREIPGAATGVRLHDTEQLHVTGTYDRLQTRPPARDHYTGEPVSSEVGEQGSVGALLRGGEQNPIGPEVRGEELTVSESGAVVNVHRISRPAGTSDLLIEGFRTDRNGDYSYTYRIHGARAYRNPDGSVTIIGNNDHSQPVRIDLDTGGRVREVGNAQRRTTRR